MRNIIAILTILLWIFSSYICIRIFPPTSESNINNFWEFKKVIYSIVIILIVSISQQKNKYTKLILLIFSGILLEDITDRLIFNANEVELNDVISLEIILFVSFFITFKKNIHDFFCKVGGFNFFNHDRNKKL